MTIKFVECDDAEAWALHPVQSEADLTDEAAYWQERSAIDRAVDAMLEAAPAVLEDAEEVEE